MKIKRSTLIPLILLAYLAVMSTFGWKQYSAGQMSATYFFGVIAITLVVIILLHFNLKRRERLKAEREADLHLAEKNKSNNNN